MLCYILKISFVQVIGAVLPKGVVNYLGSVDLLGCHQQQQNPTSHFVLFRISYTSSQHLVQLFFLHYVCVCTNILVKLVAVLAVSVRLIELRAAFAPLSLPQRRKKTLIISFNFDLSGL